MSHYVSCREPGHDNPPEPHCPGCVNAAADLLREIYLSTRDRSTRAKVREALEVLVRPVVSLKVVAGGLSKDQQREGIDK